MVCGFSGETVAGLWGDRMIKDRVYTVSQEPKSGLWYVHMVGYSYIPCFGTFRKTKKNAQKAAAEWMGIPFEVYMKLPERKGVK